MAKKSNEQSVNIENTDEKFDEESKEDVTKEVEESKEDSIEDETKSEDDSNLTSDNQSNDFGEDINTVPKKILSNFKLGSKKNRTGIICICLAILIIILVVMLYLIFSKDEKGNSMAKYLDGMRTQEVVVSDLEQVNYFFKTYYDALAAGNTTVIEGLYDEPSKANITTEVSKIVESFDNIKVYVTKGLEDNEIVAFVYNELKFPNINTLAPCVDTFYLKYNAFDNSLKIVTNMYTDASIIKFVNVVAKKDPVRSLLSSTNENLNNALEADGELKNLYLIMQSMTDNNIDGETTEP